MCTRKVFFVSLLLNIKQVCLFALKRTKKYYKNEYSRHDFSFFLCHPQKDLPELPTLYYSHSPDVEISGAVYDLISHIHRKLFEEDI